MVGSGEVGINKTMGCLFQIEEWVGLVSMFDEAGHPDREKCKQSLLLLCFLQLCLLCFIVINIDQPEASLSEGFCITAKATVIIIIIENSCN